MLSTQAFSLRTIFAVASTSSCALPVASTSTLSFLRRTESLRPYSTRRGAQSKSALKKGRNSNGQGGVSQAETRRLQAERRKQLEAEQREEAIRSQSILIDFQREEVPHSKHLQAAKEKKEKEANGEGGEEKQVDFAKKLKQVRGWLDQRREQRRPREWRHQSRWDAEMRGIDVTKLVQPRPRLSDGQRSAPMGIWKAKKDESAPMGIWKVKKDEGANEGRESQFPAVKGSSWSKLTERHPEATSATNVFARRRSFGSI